VVKNEKKETKMIAKKYEPILRAAYKLLREKEQEMRRNPSDEYRDAFNAATNELKCRWAEARKESRNEDEVWIYFHDGSILVKAGISTFQWPSMLLCTAQR
jgi:hypothetical protein